MTIRNGSNDSLDGAADHTDGVAQRLEVLADRAGKMKDQAADATRSLVGKLGATIQDHPLAAVGLAVGLGYLVMRLVRR